MTQNNIVNGMNSFAYYQHSLVRNSMHNKLISYVHNVT